jgi:hypothetical protein
MNVFLRKNCIKTTLNLLDSDKRKICHEVSTESRARLSKLNEANCGQRNVGLLSCEKRIKNPFTIKKERPVGNFRGSFG